jgi:D-alanyl-D-alanine carboxypeptidase
MRSKTFVTTALAAVLAAAAVVAVPAVPVAARTDGLHDQVAAIQRTGTTGVLAEVTDGRRQQRARAGVSTVDTGAPVPYDGEFRIGSTTKTFVATVVLQLVGEGRLSLDDTVDRWLPGVVSGHGNDGSRVTVRELLQHTSGIYNYTNDFPALASTAGFQAHRFDTYTPQQLVAIAMRHAPNFAPGTGWSYSNTNYILAGMIIEAVTGHSWAREVNARIIRPLRLRHTITPGTDPSIPGPHADGYSNFGSGPTIDVTAWNPSGADSAGSMISTTADLNRFLAALVRGRLLRPAQLTAMEATVPAPELATVIPGARYGLGLGWAPLSCGGGYYSHPGDVPGYHTRNGITPNGQRSVVVSVTGDGGPATERTTDTAVDRELCDPA